MNLPPAKTSSRPRAGREQTSSFSETIPVSDSRDKFSTRFQHSGSGLVLRTELISLAGIMSVAAGGMVANNEDMIAIGKRSTAHELANIFLEATPHDQWWSDGDVYGVIFDCLLDSAHRCSQDGNGIFKCVLKLEQCYNNAADENTEREAMKGMQVVVELALGVEKENIDSPSTNFMIPPKVHVNTMQIANTLKHYARTGEVDWAAAET